MAKVTVIITSHNRKRYIGEAVESVLAQTVQDIDVLVVDDASTDGTVAIVEGIARRDPRVRVVRNPKNLGDYPNRNYAASLVTTPYFKFHDSDDVMYPHCIQVMLSGLEQFPNAALALTGSGSWAGRPAPMLLTPHLAYQREFLGRGVFHLGPSGALFRTDAFRRLGPFPESGTGSDYLFWLQIFRSAAVVLVPSDLFFWRQHEEQESFGWAHEVDQARAKAATWDALQHADCPLTPAERETAKRNWAYIEAREIYRRVRRGQFRVAWLYWKYSRLTIADRLRYLRSPVRSATAGTPRD